MHFMPLAMIVFLVLLSISIALCSKSSRNDVEFLKDEHFIVEKEYLSICLDPYLKHDLPVAWGNFSFDNPKVLTLASGLSPAILRFGGTDADRSIFHPDKYLKFWQGHNILHTKEWAMRKSNNINVKPMPPFHVPIYEKDIDNLRKLARAAGGKLLFDLNIQLRKDDDWDPSNAMELMAYIAESTPGGKVTDMAFELGNEWPYPEYHPTPQRLAKDFIQFHQMVFSDRRFSDVFIVGPDIGPRNGWENVIGNFTKTVGKLVKALTIHNYYFKGPGADISQYFNLKHYNHLQEVITHVRGVMDNAGGKDVPLWLGETSDSYDKGTPGITNTFAGGFLWLDKLGLAAKLGVSLVARQDFYGGNYQLLNENLDPNPDYWASYTYKQLMGRKVLSFNSTAASDYVRVYAHCTATATNYLPGSITVMILNIGDLETLPFYFTQAKTIYVYTLSGDGSLVSTNVLLNGKRLQMVNDKTMPELKPVKKSALGGLVLGPKTLNFVVLSDANFKTCFS